MSRLVDDGYCTFRLHPQDYERWNLQASIVYGS